MEYECPESCKPVFNTDLPPTLKETFHRLFHEAYELFDRHDDVESILADADALHRDVTKEVTAYPVLARTICKELPQWSLLEVLYEKTFDACQETIKFLVEKNPHALLWAHEYPGGHSSTAPIHLIAGLGDNCELLPWIVERYPWIFQHKLCRNRPPHLDMMKCYVNGECDLEATRKFYELYPQGLREKCEAVFQGSYPLRLSLGGPMEPDPDFFIWMAQQYPEAVYQTFGQEFTTLHEVCSSLATNEHESEYVPFKCSPNTAKICRFLISEHPGLVRHEIRDHGYLPIHMLAHCCNRPIVQEIVLLLLKVYPECLQVKAGDDCPELSTVPFIEQVQPLIVEELELDKEILLLKQLSQNMVEATIFSRSHCAGLEGTASATALFGNFSEVFVSWINLRVSHVLSAAKGRVQDRIAETCRNLEKDDAFDGSEEEDNWDEDSASNGNGSEEMDYLSSGAED